MVVYVLGRPTQGEMIVTTLQDGDEVKYSTLTDCFIMSRRHAKVFANWCRSIGVSHFDVLIFTHPDVDHCLGVRELVAEMDAKHTSELFVPNQMFAQTDVSIEKVIAPFREISKQYNNNGKLHLQKRMPLERNVMFELQFNAPMQMSTTMQFIQIATDEQYLFFHNLDKKDKAKHNDLSLAYTIHYNNQNYLYCADLPGDYVREIDNEFFHNVRFVKIPHHGSNGSKELPSKLQVNEQKEVLSVTTTYHGLAKKRRLPSQEVLQGYMRTGNVYCTGPDLDALSQKLYKYGGVKISYKLRGNDLGVTYAGNAYQCNDPTDD